MEIEPEVIEQKAVSLPVQARSVTITDQKSFDHAANVLRGVVAVRKEIQDYHAPLKQKAHEAHKAICDAEAKMLKPVTEAETILKRSIGTYEQEQRRIQDELARRAREAAQKKADDERLAKVLEAERLARESMERMKREASSLEELVAIEEQMESVVEAAANQVKQEPEAPISYEVPNVIYKVPGVSTITTYKAEVVDFGELLQAVVEGKVPQTLVVPNESALNKMANALRKGFSVPGVRLVEVASVRASARRQ